jgi:hypothetical protein
MAKKSYSRSALIGGPVGICLAAAMFSVKKSYRDDVEGAMAIAIIAGFIGVVIWARTRAWRAKIKSMQRVADVQQGSR